MEFIFTDVFCNYDLANLAYAQFTGFINLWVLASWSIFKWDLGRYLFPFRAKVIELERELDKDDF